MVEWMAVQRDKRMEQQWVEMKAAQMAVEWADNSVALKVHLLVDKLAVL